MEFANVGTLKTMGSAHAIRDGSKMDRYVPSAAFSVRNVVAVH